MKSPVLICAVTVRRMGRTVDASARWQASVRVQDPQGVVRGARAVELADGPAAFGWADRTLRALVVAHGGRV